MDQAKELPGLHTNGAWVDPIPRSNLRIPMPAGAKPPPPAPGTQADSLLRDDAR